MTVGTPPPDRRAGDAGFTLLEVIVALSLSALVLLGARMMLGRMADGADAIAISSANTDRAANEAALLRTLMGQVELPPDSTGGLQGDGRGARMSTWCEVPAGWQERCTATLGLLRVDHEQRLVLELPGQELHVIRRGIAHGQLIYLVSAASGGEWTDHWTSRVEVPLGIGIVLDSDTLLLRIGERG
jgi:prepilin-type N-terminal cleavage/methylation domain-containing protein